MKKMIFAALLVLTTSSAFAMTPEEVFPQTTTTQPLAADTMEPTYSCPEGFSWNEELKMCAKAPDCPGNGKFNPETRKCEMAMSPKCPEGFTYHEERKQCEMPPKCPAGTHFVKGSGTCSPD